ncbi:MAG TPA: hypothetical protein VNA67_08475 [Pseudonocardiaceae bacterium]|nr:hypothetical protein [Pseudonocardiaceae bacterium]
MGVLLTMDGRQGADLVLLVGPRMTVPVHTDDHTVFRSPLSDFFAEVAQREVPSEIRTGRAWRADGAGGCPPAVTRHGVHHGG